MFLLFEPVSNGSVDICNKLYQVPAKAKFDEFFNGASSPVHVKSFLDAKYEMIKRFLEIVWLGKIFIHFALKSRSAR